MFKIGVIGGSGLYEMDGLEKVETLDLQTPWGKPSGEIVKGYLSGTELLFLPRHGRGHKIMPSSINYRANIYAMKMLNVNWIISVSAVGSMKDEIVPGNIVIPDQFIDLTRKRESTFFVSGIVAHVSMADPVCPHLSRILFESARSSGANVHMGGTYICIEGPQFSTRGESELYRKWDVDVIGMTNMPEAKLAREAEICYSTMALSTDYDCWHDEHDEVTVDSLTETLRKNVDTAKSVIKRLTASIPDKMECECGSSLKSSIITPQSEITSADREKVDVLVRRYMQ